MPGRAVGLVLLAVHDVSSTSCALKENVRFPSTKLVMFVQMFFGVFLLSIF